MRILNSIFILLMASCLFFSCEKEEFDFENTAKERKLDIRTEEMKNPVVRDGYLVFDCEEKMETFITQYAADQVDPTSIANIYGFNSYLENVVETPENEGVFGDKYFAGTLNEDGMVGVGSYVFKMNPTTEEVFVISNAASSQDRDVVRDAVSQDELPNGALSFSFEDDIFEILENETVCELSKGCGENCAPSAKNIKQEGYCIGAGGTNTSYIHARYWRGGIWHFLNTKLWHRNYTGSSLIFHGDMDIRYDVKWKKRCKDASEASRDYVCNFVPTGNDNCFPLEGDNNFKKRFYHGTRCLSKYKVKADARIQNNCDSSQIIWTGFAEITFGM